MGGGAAQGVHDLVVVPLRVGLPGRIPGCLLGEHDLAINHRRRLAIAGAQVEPDPAPVQVAAQGGARLVRGREVGLGCGDHLERDAEQQRAHEPGVEHARGCRRVVAGQVRDERLGAVHVQARRAPRP